MNEKQTSDAGITRQLGNRRRIAVSGGLRPARHFIRKIAFVDEQVDIAYELSIRAVDGCVSDVGQRPFGPIDAIADGSSRMLERDMADRAVAGERALLQRVR